VSLHPIQDSTTYCVEPMMLGCGDVSSCQSVVARIPIIDKRVSRVSLQNFAVKFNVPRLRIYPSSRLLRKDGVTSNINVL
jgi:hypothetical protein